MDVDLDTFLVAVYTHIDDLYRAALAPHKPRRPGQRPELSDSEVLTLVLLAQWLGKSERDLLRYAATHWSAYFPRLLDHSAFNRRARDLAGALVQVVPLVAQALGLAAAAYQAVDGVPVPLLRRCRGERHRLFGDEAGLGRGGSDRDWYYGVELLVAVTDGGVITGFVLGPPATDDRWLIEDLLCWRQDPTATAWTPADLSPSHRKGGGRVGRTGPVWPRSGVGAPSPVPYVTDGGMAGGVWQTHWRDAYGAWVLTPRDLSHDRTHPARRQFAGWRQVIETINQHLEDDFHLWFPGAHTAWGLLTRLAAKLAACNLGLLLNRQFDRAPFAFRTLFSG